MKEQQQQVAPGRPEGAGRLEPAAAAGENAPRRDISDIDCQEGTMQHGRLGGNFDRKEEEEEKKPQ